MRPFDGSPPSHAAGRTPAAGRREQPHSRTWRVCLTMALLVAAGLPAAAQTPGRASFRVLQRGAPIGAVDVTLSRDADGWHLRSTGTVAGTVNVLLRQFDARYTPDWHGRFLTVERAARNESTIVHVAVGRGTAHTDIVTAIQANWRSHSVSLDVVFLPAHAYGALDAVAARLHAAPRSREIPLLVAPDGEQRARVDARASRTVRTRSGPLRVTRHTLSLVGVVPRLLHVWELDGRLVRADLPEDEITVIRDDAVP